MRKINFADDLEERVAVVLDSLCIKFIHESEKGNRNTRLDFYLPDYEIYIEVKKFHTDRINEQLKMDDNVIVLQGRKSIEFFEKLTNKLNNFI